MESSNSEHEIKFPGWVKVDKEVTGDKQYTSINFAKSKWDKKNKYIKNYNNKK